MDSELAKTRASTSNTTKSKPTAPKIPKLNPRGKPSAVVESDSEPSDESDGEMDAELACLFKTVGGDGEGTMDYNLVKNFLESFQSQGGFGGPASNLSGRLGFSMPREAAEK